MAAKNINNDTGIPVSKNEGDVKPMVSRVKPTWRTWVEKQWVNGETKTWAPWGASVGAFTGFILGLIGAVTLDLYSFAQNPTQSQKALASKYNLFLFVAPMLGLVLGAVVGALIGIGTPKHNPHPMQGHWDNLRTYLRRRRH